MPAIRAVCIRLAEMVADQRHYLAPLPEPQETERGTVLNLVADGCASAGVTGGLEEHLKALEELELRSTGSWAIVVRAERVDHHRHQVPGELRRRSCRLASGPIPTGPTMWWRGSSPRCARSSGSTSCTPAPRPGIPGRSENDQPLDGGVLVARHRRRPFGEQLEEPPEDLDPAPELSEIEFLVGGVQTVVRQPDAGKQDRRAAQARAPARSGSSRRPEPDTARRPATASNASSRTCERRVVDVHLHRIAAVEERHLDVGPLGRQLARRRARAACPPWRNSGPGTSRRLTLAVACGGNDRLGALADEAAADAVDLEGRQRPGPLEDRVLLSPVRAWPVTSSRRNSCLVEGQLSSRALSSGLVGGSTAL